MVNYWKSKVLPKIKKVFENPKKAAAADACRAFDDSKEQYSKEFEDKKHDLHPKVVEIYEAASAEIKTLIKERKESALKKQSAAVQKFLDELNKIEFPGSKSVCEASSKVGPGNLPGPIFFVFEKVSTFVVVKEEVKEEAPPPVEADAPPEKKEEEPSASAAAEVKEKEIVAEEKAPPVPAEAEKTEACAAEPPKKEETPPPEKP